MRDRYELMEETHVAFLESVTQAHLEKTQAEAELMTRDQQGDPAKDLLVMMIAKKLGIPVDYIPPSGKRPPQRPNGVPKS